MGVASRIRDIRPPLPAPTESMDEGEGTTSAYETDVATNVTTRTDKTSYEVPADGSPITIPTNRITSENGDIRVSKHRRDKSQTSLLIEYFEGSKSGDKSKSKPSVRVKVTPSSRKRTSSGGHEAIQITGIGRDRKPSYTRRISLGGSSKNTEVLHVPPGTEGTEISHSSGSANPLEIEVLNSDVSTQSRGLMYAPNESNVSSMPPDSMLEGGNLTESELSQTRDYDDDVTVKKEDYLEAPKGSRDRSTSQDRITQKVMEKLGQSTSKPYKSSRSRSERSLGKEYEGDSYSTERRRRSSKSQRYEDDTVSGAGTELGPSQVSYRSGSDVSKSSRVTNNPKLLEMVEDTVKRIILPELSAIKRDQSIRSSEHSRPASYDEYSGLDRRVSKSSSSPNISSKPKVVLNRDGDDPGMVLSRGDSERKQRKSSREHRPSSRRSSGSRRASYEYDDDSIAREKSGKSSHRVRDAAAAGIAGGILTAGALKAHDRSHSEDRDRDRERRRKRSSKSRGSGSRSASIADTTEDTYALRPKEDIPPMPMASGIHDSDLTRESILSVDTDKPSAKTRTPIREVSKDSLGTPSSRTPTRTPMGKRSLGMSQSNRSIESPGSPGGRSTRDRIAALAAAGAAGVGAGALGKAAYDRTVDADGYGAASPSSQRGIGSPVQSVSSLKNKFEETLVPSDSRPQSAASRSSAARSRENAAPRSGLSSPTSHLASSRKQSQTVGADEYATPLEKPDSRLLREGTPGTPVGESMDDWYDRQHELNEQYRNSLDEDEVNNSRSFAATNRDSYQTNPYPQDEKRFTQYTDDSLGVDSQGDGDGEQDVRAIAANPKLKHHSFGAESNVASLMEPSFVSSDVRSSQISSGSPTKGSFAARLREMGKDSPSGLYNGSTVSQTIPSQDRWAALSSRAREMSTGSQSDTRSPRQSPAKSLHEQNSVEQPVMGASGLPVVDDPLPEIGHFDDTKSEVSTNPSIIRGPLGGDATGKDTWPYTPEPQQKELANQLRRSVKSDDDSHTGMKGAALGAGAAAVAAGGAYVATHRQGSKQPMVEDEVDSQRDLTPDLGRSRDCMDRAATPTSPAAFRDEGYVTENTRSAGALTPRAEPQYSRKDVDEYNRAMDAQDLGDDDPFVGTQQQHQQHARVISGNSHGMSSPLYDSATGQGVENIHSKDIVALMDHLTVRDAQRNARDTEILVSLVRSTAEMRQSFDEMKKFIVDQDRMIMADAQRSASQVKTAVKSGPRAMPSPITRTPRQSEEDIQTKRKGVLRRALKGLTGSKSAKDLERVEDMLMQILENVEDLKVQQGGMMSSGGDPRDLGGDGFARSGSLDSYEQMRNRPDDSGYEPEGQAGTSSTPSQSGYFATTPRAEKHQFHSGYDGRRGSENRVSTVLEGDEEELEPHESRVLDNQFENNEGFATPTQERSRARGFSPEGTPYGAAELAPDEITPRSTDKHRRHKSSNSSVFNAMPKISRWSKTTSSSAAPDPATIESPIATRAPRPESQASSLREYDDDGYSLRSHGRQRSMQSFDDLEQRSMRSQGRRLSRTPSPLIPSEASTRARDEYNDGYGDRAVSPIQEDSYVDNPEFDDPKYQAHRNSLLLQHPQPRQGHTGRHQNNLESKAHVYEHENVSATDSNLSQRTVSDDIAMFGSSDTAALSKHRFSQMTADPASPASVNNPRGPGGYGGNKNDAPLIPQAQKPAPSFQPNNSRYEDEDDEDEDDYYDEQDREPQYSNSGFSRGGYYSSPFGSGHLLEPIEEVRYSLETDSGHSPEPEAQPQVAKAINTGLSGRGGVRKITGPRPMNFGAARRKPVGSAGE